jgi:hypothetical protein
MIGGMAFSLPEHPVPLMDPHVARLYDCPDPYPDEGDLSLELPGPRARYEQLASELRKDIYAGVYPVGSVLKAESELARDLGISRALVNRALQDVAEQELVSQEQGRGTYVRKRRVYRVQACVPAPGDGKPGSGPALRRAVARAAKDEPAVASVDEVSLGSQGAVITLLVEAADGDWAVHAAKLVVRAAGKTWSWEGWDLTLASWHCDPAQP